MRPQFGDVGLALVAAVSCFAFRNNDLWWHLAAGRWMSEHQRFVSGDPFSYTGFMGDWIDNEWLSQLVFFGTWSFGSLPALIMLRAACYGGLFLLVRGYLRAARMPSVFLPALIAGVLLSYEWWELRPSVFSLLLFVGLLWILERFRRTGRGDWLLPALFVVWANTYPGFVFGLIVLIATLVAWSLEPRLSKWRPWASKLAKRKALFGATVAAAAATLVNPYGWNVYRQQFDVLRNVSFRAALDEFAPPAPVFSCFVIGCCAFFVWRRFQKTPLPSMVPILGTAALSLTAVKFQEYFAVAGLTAMMAHLGRPKARGLSLYFVLAVLLCGLVVSVLEPMPTVIQEGSKLGPDADPVVAVVHQRALRNAVLLAVLFGASSFGVLLRRVGVGAAQRNWRSVLPTPYAALVVLVVAATTTGASLHTGVLPPDGVEAGRYPTRCLSVLPGGDEERVFSRLSWGGWLIWHLRLSTFVDGRGWGQPLFFEYGRTRGPEGLAILEAWKVKWAILAPRDALATELSRAVDWELVCTDDASVAFHTAQQAPR